MKDREHGGGSSSPELSGSPNTLLSTLPPQKKTHSSPFIPGLCGALAAFCGVLWLGHGPRAPRAATFPPHRAQFGVSSCSAPFKGTKGSPCTPSSRAARFIFLKKMRKKAKLESQGERQWGASAPSPGSAEPSVPSELKNPKPTPKHAQTLPSLRPPEKLGKKRLFLEQLCTGISPSSSIFFLNPLFAGRGGRDPALKSRAMGWGFPMGTPPAPCCLSPPR